MAENGVLVNISGPALSLLLYENARSTGDQIGLLFGNVLTFSTKKVTDCDRQIERTEHHINVDTVMVCSKEIVHDGIGRIDKEKLEALVKSKEKRVVGWFRFRSHHFLQPTMKDKIMHKELSSYFLKQTHVSEEYFIMFLLNTSTTTLGGTHKYRHVCVQYYQGAYRPLALRINNLGDDLECLDGSDYKSVPKRMHRESDVFTKLVEDLKLNPSTTSSVNMVTTIEKQAEDYLHKMISQVCKSDEEISKLQEQVNEIRSRIQKSNFKRSCYLQKERRIESQHNAESEKILATSQIHGSPRSTHSDDMFDSEQLPNVPSSPYLNSHSLKKSNLKRTNQTISKESRSNSSPEAGYSEINRNDSSPESTRSKEKTSKSKGVLDDKLTKKQTTSPKSFGRKSDRHSFGDFSGNSQEEAYGKKDQTP